LVLESDHASPVVFLGAWGVGRGRQLSFAWASGRASFPSFAGRGDVGGNVPREGEELDDFFKRLNGF
jgi:hypothetical protein